MSKPIATWNPERMLWETETLSLFSEHSEPYSETFPTSGSMRSGRLFPLQVSEPLISGSGFSSLPTPRASRGSSTTEISYALGGERTDTDRVQGRVLLPTPRANGRDEGWPESAGIVGGSDAAKRSDGSVDLLQTPSAADGDGSRKARGGSRSGEPLLPGQAVEMAHQWGKYEAAIRRWESVTRPAPSPTEANTKGNPRLSAAFPEWMMGWPAGWVTAVLGISRNDQLRIIGNGVCPQQAVAAVSWLLRSLEVVA